MPHRETDIFDIGIEELIRKNIAESAIASLKSYLEKILDYQDSLELRDGILQDWLVLRNQVNRRTKAILNLGSTNLEDILDLFEMFLNFFHRYRAFIPEDLDEELKQAKDNAMVKLDFFRALKLTENSLKQREIFIFLSQFNQGLDIIVHVLETNANIFPLHLQSSVRLFLNQLPGLIQNKLEKLEISPGIETEVKRYTRVINRAILSGTWHLDFWSTRLEKSSVETGESWREKQIKLNQPALNMVESWLQETQRINFTAEMEEDNQELMRIIDDNRERKLFSDYYT